MRDEIRERIEAVRRGEVPEGYVVENHQLRPVEWGYDRIGEHLIAYDEYSNDTERYPLATSSRQGLMLQTDYYGDQRYDETTGGFHVVPEGYITYRHMSDDDVFKFNMNTMGTPVLVSPEYPVFTTDGNLDKTILVEYLNGMKEFRAFCSAQKKGSTRTRMYFNRLGEFSMPIPPVAEQRRIAEILDACDSVIKQKQELIEGKCKQKQILMARLLDPAEGSLDNERELWTEVTLGSECLTFSGGTPSAGKEEFYKCGTIPFIRSAEIGARTTELYLTEAGFDNSAAKMVEPGDILYALYGANSGDCAISKIHGAINQAILCIRPKTIDKELLYYALCYRKDSIVSTYLQGGQGNLSAEIIKSITLKLPQNPDYIKGTICILQLLDRELEGLEEELVLWQQKKKALMQLLLTGIVRVNA